MGNASRLAVLSGPNFAAEVIRGIPSGTVIASSNEETAAFFQQLFASETFRTYVSDDVCGVELCAAFKNVIAIAVGVSYGLGYGDNTAAKPRVMSMAAVLSHGRSAGTLVLANRKSGFDNLSECPSSRLSCEPPPLSLSLKPSTGREHAHLPPSPLCALHSLPRVPPTQGRLFYARSSASKYFDASTPSFASFTAPTHGAPAEATRPGL